MIRRILARLFGPSLETLLTRARDLGNVRLQTMAIESGPGWHCTISPPTSGRSMINEWSGIKSSAREAVLEALDEAELNPVMIVNKTPNAPKLGGREFDG